MQIPKIEDYPIQIYLRGSTYKIVFVNNLKDIGVTDPSARVIKIRAGMSKNETFRTFLHEILHFLEFEWPVKLTHKQVYKLEKAIFQLLLDNFL